MKQQIHDLLQNVQLRPTPVRVAILEALYGTHSASADELTESLRGAIPSLNRTTVYRELSQLATAGLLDELLINQRAKRYELKADHHHHLICSSCDAIEPVRVEDSFSALEKQLAEQFSFAVDRHALEFYGHCKVCQETT